MKSKSRGSSLLTLFLNSVTGSRPWARSLSTQWSASGGQAAARGALGSEPDVSSLGAHKSMSNDSLRQVGFALWVTIGPIPAATTGRQGGPGSSRQSAADPMASRPHVPSGRSRGSRGKILPGRSPLPPRASQRSQTRSRPTDQHPGADLDDAAILVSPEFRRLVRNGDSGSASSRPSRVRCWPRSAPRSRPASSSRPRGWRRRSGRPSRCSSIRRISTSTRAAGSGSPRG